MKSLLIFLTLCTLLTTTNSLADTQEISLKPFKQISLQNNIHVNISFAKQQRVKLSGSPKLIKNILLKVSKNTLVAKEKVVTCYKKNQCPYVTLSITLPALNTIKVASNAEATINKIVGKATMIYAQDYAHITITGKTDSLISKLSGNTRLDATGLQSNNVLVYAQDNARASVNVSNLLFIRGSGNSQITYSGSPKTINKILSNHSKLTHS